MFFSTLPDAECDATQTRTGWNPAKVLYAFLDAPQARPIVIARRAFYARGMHSHIVCPEYRVR